MISALALACGISCSSYRGIRLLPAEAVLDGDGGALDLQWTGDYAFVEASVNGRGPLRLLLDAGASVVVMDPGAADRLNLHRVPLSPETAGIDLEAAQATTIRVREAAPIRELRAGPLRLRDVDASIIDLSPLAAVAGRSFDGILPAAAFRDFLLEIDYPGRKAAVRRGALPAPGDEPGGSHVLPLTPDFLPHVLIYFDDRPDGEPISVLLDTGSSGFLSVPRVPALRFRSDPVETGRHVTLGAAVAKLQGRLDGTVRWAGHSLENPVVALAADGRGSAGASLFRHFRLTFDMTRRRVSFEREAADPIRCLPVRGIGAGTSLQAGRWVVSYVIDGSPAARAGLVPGDRIEMAGGIPVADMPGVVFDVLVTAGPSVRMRVSGPSGERDLEIPIATFVE